MIAFTMVLMADLIAFHAVVRLAFTAAMSPEIRALIALNTLLMTVFMVPSTVVTTVLMAFHTVVITVFTAVI